MNMDKKNPVSFPEATIKERYNQCKTDADNGAGNDHNIDGNNRILFD
jgi:hypothetical protein